MADQQIDYDKLAAEIRGAASHDSSAHAEARPIATGGGRGTGLDVRKSDAWLKDSAPALGAALAVGAGPTGVIASPLMAGAGGLLGSLARGDEAGPSTVEGIKQAGMQVVGNGLGWLGGKVANGLMKGTVPKNIAKDFQGQVDIPQEMLNRGVFPGSSASARRVTGLSKLANAERDAAAATVPTMPRSKVIAGLRPIHAEAITAKEPQMASDTLEYMRDAARSIGPEGLSGEQQLARKTIKQRQGKAALSAGNSKEAALTPQLADAERSAIVSHMRETPRMERALDESQTLMAIDDVMKDAALSNPVTRMRIGGFAAGAMSPIGLGATAHAVNQGSRALNPNVLRLLDMIMAQGSHQQ